MGVTSAREIGKITIINLALKGEPDKGQTALSLIVHHDQRSCMAFLNPLDLKKRWLTPKFNPATLGYLKMFTGCNSVKTFLRLWAVGPLSLTQHLVPSGHKVELGQKKLGVT